MGIIYIKTSQEQKYDMNHLYELFCSNNWCSSRLIFLVKMAPNVTEKLDYTLVASGQRLVLAVVNSSDWDTDDHMQSCNGLDKEIRKMKKLYNSACMGHNS